jgi:pyruvate-formate lyase-activating enzyme
VTITAVQLLALEAHARAHNGGLGDRVILDLIAMARHRHDPLCGQAQRSLVANLEIMTQMGERPCVLVTLDGATTIPRDEVEALALAVGRAVGHRDEYPLINLLRRLAPKHETLAHLDRIAREHGFVQAGSDERAEVEEGA